MSTHSPESLATIGPWLAPTRTLAAWKRAPSLLSVTSGLFSPICLTWFLNKTSDQVTGCFQVQGRWAAASSLSSHSSQVLWHRWGGWCHLRSKWRWCFTKHDPSPKYKLPSKIKDSTVTSSTQSTTATTRTTTTTSTLVDPSSGNTNTKINFVAKINISCINS